MEAKEGWDSIFFVERDDNAPSGLYEWWRRQVSFDPDWKYDKEARITISWGQFFPIKRRLTKQFQKRVATSLLRKRKTREVKRRIGNRH